MKSRATIVWVLWSLLGYTEDFSALEENWTAQKQAWQKKAWEKDLEQTLKGQLNSIEIILKGLPLLEAVGKIPGVSIKQDDLENVKSKVGIALKEQGDLERAKKYIAPLAFDESKQKINKQAMLQLLEMLLFQENWDELFTTLKKATALYGEEPAWKYFKVLAYWNQAKQEAVLSDLEQLSTTKTYEQEASWMLGLLYFEKQQLDLAASYFEKVSTLEGLLALIKISLIKGDDEGAKKYIEKASSKYPHAQAVSLMQVARILKQLKMLSLSSKEKLVMTKSINDYLSSIPIKERGFEFWKQYANALELHHQLPKAHEVYLGLEGRFKKYLKQLDGFLSVDAETFSGKTQLSTPDLKWLEEQPVWRLILNNQAYYKAIFAMISEKKEEKVQVSFRADGFIDACKTAIRDLLLAREQELIKHKNHLENIQGPGGNIRVMWNISETLKPFYNFLTPQIELNQIPLKTHEMPIEKAGKYQVEVKVPYQLKSGAGAQILNYRANAQTELVADPLKTHVLSISLFEKEVDQGQIGIDIQSQEEAPLYAITTEAWEGLYSLMNEMHALTDLAFKQAKQDEIERWWHAHGFKLSQHYVDASETLSRANNLMADMNAWNEQIAQLQGKVEQESLAYAQHQDQLWQQISEELKIQALFRPLFKSIKPWLDMHFEYIETSLLHLELKQHQISLDVRRYQEKTYLDKELDLNNLYEQIKGVMP